MKLASLNNGSRDGRLVVVDTTLQHYAEAGDIAGTLQAGLDNWPRAARALADRAEALEAGRAASQPLDPAGLAAPLPRAYQWADGSAYVNHVELVRRARGAELPESFWHDPLMYQGGSDVMLAPRGDIPVADPGWGVDMEGEVAVITGDVPMGASYAEAARAIQLICLVNDVSLRNLIPAELAKGFGFFQSKPPTALSPVAVTPDELGSAWDGAKLHLPLHVDVNGRPFGRAEAGVDMTFDFPALIQHAAKTRPLTAGTIVGSGTVSNKLAGGPGKPVSEGGVGYSCIAEQRMIETIQQGQAQTPFLQVGDRVSIEMLDGQGRSIFGRIDQQVAAYQR